MHQRAYTSHSELELTITDKGIAILVVCSLRSILPYYFQEWNWYLSSYGIACDPFITCVARSVVEPWTFRESLDLFILYMNIFVYELGSCWHREILGVLFIGGISFSSFYRSLNDHFSLRVVMDFDFRTGRWRISVRLCFVTPRFLLVHLTHTTELPSGLKICW